MRSIERIGLFMDTHYAHYKPQIKADSLPMIRTTGKPRRGKASRMPIYKYDHRLFADRVELILQTKFHGSRKKWAAAGWFADGVFTKIQNGIANPELATLWALAKAAGVTVSQLLGETPLDDPDASKAAPDERLIRIAADLRSLLSAHSSALESLHDSVNALIKALRES